MATRLQSIVLFLLLLTIFTGAPVERCEAVCIGTHSHAAACEHSTEAEHAATLCHHHQSQHVCIHWVADTQQSPNECERRTFAATIPESASLSIPSRTLHTPPTLLRAQIGAVHAEMRLPMLC